MVADVMAWNVLDAFSDEKRARGVLEVVQGQLPDAAILTEAWQEGKGQWLDYVLEDLEAKDYTVAYGLYEDKDDRKDRHGMIGIVRNRMATVHKPYLVSLVSRNALYLPLLDQDNGIAVDFFGVHLDDRSEDRRLEQVDALLAMARPCKRVILGGDFNAMHRNDRRAKALRVVRPLAQRMPAVDPQPDVKPPKIKRIGSLASRLTNMALGTTIEKIEAAGFEDADLARRPTKGPFNLDHIFTKGVIPTRPYRLGKTILSDHRPVGAQFYAY